MYKKIKIISTIIVILLTFPFHFMYQIKPNFLTAIFFPINESIWEHLKLFITPALIAFIVEMLIIKKERICMQNNYLALLTEIAISIGAFLTIFLPFYFKMGENIFFTIIVMITAIIFSKYIGYLLVKEKNVADYFEFSPIERNRQSPSHNVDDFDTFFSGEGFQKLNC